MVAILAARKIRRVAVLNAMFVLFPGFALVPSLSTSGGTARRRSVPQGETLRPRAIEDRGCGVQWVTHI